MKNLKIGIIREGKVPPDERVPFAPQQAKALQEKFPTIQVKVQSSKIRAYKDEEYVASGIEVVDDVSDCDVLMGVKEVNIEDLIANKIYFFFSHTFKKQPYNRKLLQAVIQKKIQLVDYEVLTDKSGQRIIGFGRYAGIVGCYNGFLTYGKKHGLYDLKPAHDCDNYAELKEELKKVKLPANTKIIATGFGRVGKGAREIFEAIGLKEVEAEAYKTQTFNEAVFTQIEADEYTKRADGQPFDKNAFYKDGSGHISTFPQYLPVTDMYVACHYWGAKAPFIFTREDLKEEHVKLSVVADISCDIDGPVACTIRPSTIADPIYGYHPQSESEVDFMKNDAIAVMAVDNLPCELPKDASEHFGDVLIRKVMGNLVGEDTDAIIERGSETNLNGELMPKFSYLQNYLEGKE